MKIVAVALALLLTACGSPEDGGSGAGDGQAGADPKGGKMASMQTAIEELQAREEIDVDAVTVQHCLISFAGTGTKAKRSKAAAEKLAEEIWHEAIAGADFDALASDPDWGMRADQDWKQRMTQFRSASATLRSGLDRMTAPDLQLPCATEIHPAFRESLRNRGQWLAGHVFHMAYHQGQAALILAATGR